MGVGGGTGHRTHRAARLPALQREAAQLELAGELAHLRREVAHLQLQRLAPPPLLRHRRACLSQLGRLVSGGGADGAAGGAGRDGLAPDEHLVFELDDLRLEQPLLQGGDLLL